jgi:hypothetical protein
VNVHFTSDDRALDAARSAGFTWVRTDLFWSRVEKVAGVYDFSPWDQLVASLEQRDMKYLAILCYGNALHTGTSASPPTTPAAIDAFGDYAEAAARHFDGRPVRFEVWNEPNVSGFWPPAASPTQYADLAKVANDRVRQGSDAAQVAVGSISWLDFDFVQGALAAGAGAGADTLSWHPYLSRPESLPDHLLLMRSIVAASPSSGLDIWESEWGYTSASFGDGHSVEARNRQANLVSREILSAWAMGFPLIVYYDLRDDGTDPANGEHNFGLLARDYSAKPALHAVRTITSLAKERSLVGILQGGSTALHGLELEGPSDRVLMVWSHVPGASVRLLVPPSATGVDFLGNLLDLEPVGVGLMLEMTVSEEAGPVFLTFPRDSGRRRAPIAPSERGKTHGQLPSGQ